ncbi:MAG TPA: Xaa-Pro peptidase family protein [Bryobacteraceae bacterium]|jgi:Xaa-Pro aminopeptidase|nr:Xaa-Pro peptidase family protein [Bryobacteraceae bacterium]
MSINQTRLTQLTALMSEHGWDLLLLYGHTWRKDYFRCLVNFNFSGPHAVAALDRSGQVQVIVSDPWDAEALPGSVFAPDFAAAVQPYASKSSVAVAGKEIMQSRFTTPAHVSATYLVEELRRVKSEDELIRIRQAAELSDRGYQHFAQVAQPGMTEYELVAETEAFLKRNGAEDNFMLIASGGTEVVGMKPPTERKLQVGDSVTTELTPQIDGYWAQICRTLVIGEPNDKQQEAYGIFAEARQAAEDSLKPGVNIADVAKATNDVFRKYGYGEYTGSKYTRVRGHNLGLHPDENPYVLEDVNYTVKEGMVVICHPNTYLPLSGYMVFGDTLLVAANGCTSLNTTERKLFRK